LCKQQKAAGKINFCIKVSSLSRGNNQTPNSNDQTITNLQTPITKPGFGNWVLDIEICLVIVAW
jgi:hypothetical protein